MVMKKTASNSTGTKSNLSRKSPHKASKKASQEPFKKAMSHKKTPSKRRHGFLWITDPWDTLDHAKDTTLRLAQEALFLGLKSHWCDVRSIRWDQDRVLLDAYS